MSVGKRFLAQFGAGWPHFQAEISVLGTILLFLNYFLCFFDTLDFLSVGKRFLAQFGAGWPHFQAEISVLAHPELPRASLCLQRSSGGLPGDFFKTASNERPLCARYRIYRIQRIQRIYSDQPEVVSSTAARTLPSTRAGGQDDGSYTNSLKLIPIS